MKHRFYPCFTLFLIALARLLTACSDSGKETERPDASVDLAGTKWELTLLNGNGLIEGTEITLDMEETFLS